MFEAEWKTYTDGQLLIIRGFLDDPFKYRYSLNILMAQRLFLTVVAVALLFLQFGDCMSAMTQGQQSMKCCASMPCAPSNQNQSCCKHMVSSQKPSILPTRHISLDEPNVAILEYARMLEIVRSSPATPVRINSQQHSPPDLYTLNSSFLI